MNRSCLFPLLLALAPVALSAQTSATPVPPAADPPQDRAAQFIQRLSTPPSPEALPPNATQAAFPATIYILPAASACPVGMRAQREMAGGTIEISHEPRSSHAAIAQRLRISLQGVSQKQILSARIVAHGYGPTARITDTRLAPTRPDELTRTLDLQFSASTRSAPSADVVLDSFAAVTRIDLLSLQYADGTTWQSPASEACHFAPDLLMLVTSL